VFGAELAWLKTVAVDLPEMEPEDWSPWGTAKTVYSLATGAIGSGMVAALGTYPTHYCPELNHGRFAELRHGIFNCNFFNQSPEKLNILQIMIAAVVLAAIAAAIMYVYSRISHQREMNKL
jgi:hypothetical protein